MPSPHSDGSRPDEPAGRQDLYEVLGVARDADPGAIKQAYRKLARRYHPDVNPGDVGAEERFKAISQAYAVLSDEEKRRNYDEFGDVSLEGGFDPEAARRAREAFGARFGGGGGGGGEGGFGAGAEGFAFGDLDDLLGNLFSRHGGSGAGPAFSMPGPDLRAELELDFLEAARGSEKRLTLTRPTADGGARTETVTVRIPPGVDDGGRIRIAGKGGEGRGGGPAGDLWAHIRVRPHPVFRRRGLDLDLDVPITVREAILGAKVEVPTLDGRVTLTVPAGTDGGTRLRLRGKGVARPGGARGDLYAHVRIRVPRNLDDEARAALDALAPFEPDDLREDLRS